MLMASVSLTGLKRQIAECPTTTNDALVDLCRGVCSWVEVELAQRNRGVYEYLFCRRGRRLRPCAGGGEPRPRREPFTVLFPHKRSLGSRVGTRAKTPKPKYNGRCKSKARSCRTPGSPTTWMDVSFTEIPTHNSRKVREYFLVGVSVLRFSDLLALSMGAGSSSNLPLPVLHEVLSTGMLRQRYSWRLDKIPFLDIHSHSQKPSRSTHFQNILGYGLGPSIWPLEILKGKSQC